MGFLSGLTDLLGGFNAARRIDTEGFDWREKAAQAEAARQQQQTGWQQQNEDWATKAATEASLGAPEDFNVESTIPQQVGDAATRARIALRAGGASRQSKSALKQQDIYSRQLEQQLRNQGALDVTKERGEQAQALARVKAALDAGEQPSPRDIALIEKRGEIQKDVATTIAGMRDKKGDKLYPITTTDAKGNTIQTFITEEQARSMAGGNAVPGASMSGIAKPEGQTVQARVRGAAASLQVGNELLRELSDPKVQEHLGPIMGRYSSLEAAAGAGDPIAMRIYGEIKSFSALQPGIHGMRATSMMKDIEDSLKLGQNPEALSAKIQGINRAAEALINPNAALSSESQTVTFGGKAYRLKPGADRRFKSSWEEVTQ